MKKVADTKIVSWPSIFLIYFLGEGTAISLEPHIFPKDFVPLRLKKSGLLIYD
jgi:uroporphyrinogen-III synthase